MRRMNSNSYLHTNYADNADLIPYQKINVKSQKKMF